MSYYIFGAHSRGQTLCAYLKKLHPEWEFKGFLYDNDEPNPETIEGFPVVRLAAGNPFNAKKCATVYVATRGIYHENIARHLKECGFSDIIPVDVNLDMELRNKFVRLYFEEHGWDYTKLEPSAIHLPGDTCIYAVRSAVDSPLAMSKELGPSEQYIQAGRALAEQGIAGSPYLDNTGDNISHLNRQFCELTAMYWIWKNAEQSWVGLEHYRRRFILDGAENNVEQGQMNHVENGRNDFQVILPVPLFVAPSIEGNYLSRHLSEPWEAMLDALERLHGCGHDARDYFANTGCYSPCNMLIAEKPVFDALCEWLFPVLFDVQKKCGQYEDSYQNRYPGFLSERLITYFFYQNRDKYRVAYCDKNFLQ